MRILRALTVVYGLLCLLASGYFLKKVHYQEIVNNSPYYVNNRFYIMSIFFPRWESIAKAYDPQCFDEKTPKWYEVIKESTFSADGAIGKGFQENKAKEYIRKYVENSAGIDHKKVKEWLFEIINFVNHKVGGYESFEEVFLTMELSNKVAETHLMQVLSFIPFREHLRIFCDEDSLFLLSFPILFGVPLFVSQLGYWGYNLAKQNSLKGIWITRRSGLIILFLSLVVGLYYLISGSIDEYNTGKTTSFISGTWFWLQMGVFYGVSSSVGAFLGFWGLKVLWQSLTFEFQSKARLAVNLP